MERREAPRIGNGARQRQEWTRLLALHPLGMAAGEEEKTAYPGPQRIRMMTLANLPSSPRRARTENRPRLNDSIFPSCYRIAMPALTLPLTEAAAHFAARGSLLGLDLGSKTVGVAVSDPERRLATGVTTIARTNFTADAKALLALAAERSVIGFVLGLPINMDGSEGPRAQSTRAFARNLAKLTELPIALWDERLSTAAVERGLIANDVSRAKRAAVIDEHAAIFILQGALDRLANLKAD
jgi:putative Holliday junction resolvase